MPLLSVTDLCKTFGQTAALSGVSFNLLAGEVHALVGENGAGKSTLCRIVAGLLRPDSGSMQLRDRPYTAASRRQAEHAGVRMVMQELNLIPTLSVAENIFLDSLPRTFGIIRYRRLNALAQSAMDQLGLKGVHPAQPLSSLGVGQRQLVEIAAALARRCDILILDEPTAALTDAEITLLFDQIRALQKKGTGVIYVSHRMDEIRQIADRITILRDGRWIATEPASSLSHAQIVRLMVGRDLPQTAATASARPTAAPILSVRHLQRRPSVQDVSFDLHGGEILGLAGLMGSGRTETLRALFGADPADSGQLLLRGQPIRIASPHQAVQHGIALVTEDRKAQGLLLPFAIARNITLPHLAAVSRAGCLLAGREEATAHHWASSLSIRCRSTHQAAQSLSGGNQQKVVLAKWLFRDCDILLLDEPTRGVDVGAKFEIYQLLRDLAGRGKAILVVSSELPELLLLCDRIAVMSAGHLVSTFTRPEFSQDLILHAALSRYMKGSAA